MAVSPRWPPFGGSWPAGASSLPSRRSVPRAPSSGSRRTSPNRGAGDPLPPLPSLPPPDLWKGGALPPDPEEVAPQAAQVPSQPGAPDPAGLVPVLLQHRSSPPGDRAAHPGTGLQSQTESHPIASGGAGSPPLPDPQGQGRHHRSHDPSAQLTAAPHRSGSRAGGDKGAGSGGWPARAGTHRGRRAPA